MNLGALMLLALGISMDNFAVSLGIGTANPVRRVKEHVRLAIVFGVFQFFMPLLGWLGGSQIIFLSHGYESRFLCAALAFVGWCMLRSSKESNQTKHIDLSSLSPVLSLAFATSVDSLAVGFGLAMVRVNILQASGVIGAVTACLSLAGMLFGGQLGRALGNAASLQRGWCWRSSACGPLPCISQRSGPVIPRRA
jgi:manganese efflux pump family protein